MLKGAIKTIVLVGLVLAAISIGGEILAASPVPICQIQGNGFSSPRYGQSLRTQGVVTADFDNTSTKGFFIQADNCDSNPSTSDGIFVYLDESIDIVSAGDFVEVSGTVAEYFGLTRLDAAPGAVQVISQGNPLPPGVDLQPPFDNEQARAYFESLEGMLVELADARVVGPTDSREDTWVIRSDLGLERVFQDDLAGTGEVICVSSGGHYEIQLSVVGNQVLGLHGVLDFSLGVYRMQLLTEPASIPAPTSFSETSTASGLGFTFGTFNLNNLFDVVDDPDKDDSVLTSAEYQRKLDKLALTIRDGLGEPAFLAVQEAENEIVLNHLLARDEIEADYGVVWLDGPDTRSIDVALLYRPDQVTVLDFEQRQGCTTLVDGLGPDGDRNVQDPHNSVTCDTDSNGALDGNRLFSRPPLLVHLEAALSEGETLPLWVLVNHFKSKREDTSTQVYTLPRRLEQAQFVAALVDEILAAYPGAAVIVL
ncbi:MAG: hypothetical protein KKD28_04050, partial [Chloroflexi bacterium]|nr:hypothetical protein [Chloroflexota bacterium]